MVKILYNGTMSKGNSDLIGPVEKGKIYNVDKKVAKRLVLNPDFIKVEDKPKEVKKEKKNENSKFPNIKE